MRFWGINKRLYIQLLFLILNLTVYGDISEEPWNYTPNNFKDHRKAGYSLKISNDSSWFPELFKLDFLLTIEFILSEDDGVIRTTGVNMDDFYHCHILCTGRCNNELESIILNFERAFRRDRSFAMGGGGKYDELFSPDNVHAASLVIREYEKRGNILINDLIKTNKCYRPAILCHTFEENKPEEMKYGDPRRNILTFLGEKPKGYIPPDIDYTTSYREEFCHIFQVPF